MASPVASVGMGRVTATATLLMIVMGHRRIAYHGKEDASQEDTLGFAQNETAEKVASEQWTWILGEEGASCTAACKARGGECLESKLKTITTSEEIKNVAAAAGVTCKSGDGATISWSYDFNPAQHTDPGSCGDGSCQGICSFGDTGHRSCAATGPQSRFCPCSEEPKGPELPVYSGVQGQLNSAKVGSDARTWHWAYYHTCRYENDGEHISFVADKPADDHDFKYAIKMAVMSGVDIVLTQGTAYKFINIHNKDEAANAKALPVVDEVKCASNSQRGMLVRQSPKMTSEVCPKADDDKEDCGYHGIGPDTCRSRGCCWSEPVTSGRNTPWCFYTREEDSYIWLTEDQQDRLEAQIGGLLGQCENNLDVALRNMITEAGWVGQQLDVADKAKEDMMLALISAPLGVLGGAALGKVGSSALAGRINGVLTNAKTGSIKTIGNALKNFGESEYGKALAQEAAKEAGKFTYNTAKDYVTDGSNQEMDFTREVWGWAGEIRAAFQKLNTKVKNRLHAMTNHEILEIVAAMNIDFHNNDDSDCHRNVLKKKYNALGKTLTGMLSFGDQWNNPSNPIDFSRVQKGWCDSPDGPRFADFHTTRSCPARAPFCEFSCSVHRGLRIDYAQAFQASLDAGMMTCTRGNNPTGSWTKDSSKTRARSRDTKYLDCPKTCYFQKSDDGCKLTYLS